MNRILLSSGIVIFLITIFIILPFKFILFDLSNQGVTLSIDSIDNKIDELQSKPKPTSDKRFSFALFDTVYAQVTSVFSLSVSVDKIDFGEVWPGITVRNYPPGGVAVTVRSDYPDTWYLKIRITNLLRYEKPDGTFVEIPQANFRHMSTGGTGTHAFCTGPPDSPPEPPPPYGADGIPTTYCPYYTCNNTGDPDEAPTPVEGVTITSYFKIYELPANQKPGNYTTVLLYKLTTTL